MFFCLPIKVGQTNDKEIIPIVNLFLISVNLLAFLFPGIMDVCGYFIYSTGIYAFVHADFWHLLVNMWVLWVFGNKVNRRLGNFWYACTYLGTMVVMGVFLRLILRINVIGASGAVFAVLALGVILTPAALVDIICIVFFPLSLLVCLFSKPKCWVYWFVRWGQLRIKAVWGLFIVPALQIAGLFWRGWNWTNLGHLLGLMCGVGAVLILPQHITMRQTLGEEKLLYKFD